MKIAALQHLNGYELDRQYLKVGNYTERKELEELGVTTLAKWAATAFRPHAVVKDYWLQVLVHHAQCATLKYMTEPAFAVMPGPEMVKRRVADLANEGKAHAMQLLKVNANFLAITTDLWTSRSNKSFIGITCHFISPEFCMTSKTLTTKSFKERHTGLNLRRCFQSTMNDFQLHWYKRVNAATDSAANLKFCFGMLENDFEERICQHPEETTIRKKIIKVKERTSPRYGRLACAAHDLHLIVTTVTSKASLDALLKQIKAWKQVNVNDDTRDIEIQALAEAAVEKYTDRDLRVAFKTLKNLRTMLDMMEMR